MSLKQLILKTPKPIGYALDDWDFRMERIAICDSCDKTFEMEKSGNEAPERTVHRYWCGECSCSCYMISGDVYKQRCPLNKWPVMEGKPNYDSLTLPIEETPIENIQYPAQS